uniref:Uncharacterized protein n=1 Tax=Araneus ventricosus TaxID=182803 RepID=A0A4Y2JFD5_ARAVE|nr:hypothetical protein AVEN_58801-1 [Araneus ventricosus]
MSLTRQTCGQLAANSSHVDFEACVNLLQTCFTLALLSCQICCKLADLQCMSAANLLQTKIAIWAILQVSCKPVTSSEVGCQVPIWEMLSQYAYCGSSVSTNVLHIKQFRIALPMLSYLKICYFKLYNNFRPSIAISKHDFQYTHCSYWSDRFISKV